MNFNYAGFWRRFLASFLDGIILMVVNLLIGVVTGLVLGLTGVDSNSTVYTMVMSVINILNYLVMFSYYVYFIGSRGQTVGKMIMGIKVMKFDGSNPSYVSAFLREVVGKLLSSIVLLLGYLWMLWDSKKQTWHDKIAGTVVVRI